MNQVLVGRGGELSVLGDAVERARAGRGSLVLLAGEAGVGKTVLSRLALRDSALRVFEAAARQAGTAPYGQLVGVLRAHRRQNPGAPDADALLAELANAPHSKHAVVLDRLAATFVAVCGERPTGVLLDDLQWADEGTLKVMVGLAPLVESEPVLVLGTYRSDELSRTHPLRRLRNELRRQRRLNEMSLEPLQADETGMLLERVCGDRVSESLVAVVLERTGGVPFFVEELGAAVLAGGRLRAGSGGLELSGREELPLPDNIRDAVLLRAPGSMTPPMVLWGWRRLSDRDSIRTWPPDWPDSTAGRRRRYGAASWSRCPADGWRSVTISSARRSMTQCPGRSARRCIDRSPSRCRTAEPRLRQSQSIGPMVASPDRARRAFLRAAEEFCAVYACRDGARAIRRALDLWPERAEESDRLDALERLGEAAERAGDLTGSLRAWREAASERRTRGEPGPLGDALRGVAGVLELQGRWEDALDTRQQAAEAFAEAARPADAANERLAAAAHLRSAASFRASLMMLQHAKAEAIETQRPEIEARALGLEGNVRGRMGEAPQRSRSCRARWHSRWSAISPAPPPRSITGWLTLSSMPASTKPRERPTRRPSNTAPQTRSSRCRSCAWDA